MPFIVRDPWRLQYFTGVTCPTGTNIYVDDLDCWEHCPDLRYVYDKLFIAQSQQLACGLGNDIPGRFPVFAKPRINLKGMGAGSFPIGDEGEFHARMSEGHMWMTMLQGEHLSTDCAVSDGKVTWIRHALGAAWDGGMFKHWTIEAKGRQALADKLSNWISKHIPRYTGMINIETIGGSIIEAQLRFADQWCDLYGTGWLDAVARLYGDGKWDFPTEPSRDSFSIPLFMKHGQPPPHPSTATQSAVRAMPGISSLQITYHQGRSGDAHTMPPGGFRLAVINATDFASGISARNALAQAFPDCALLLP